MDIQSSILDEKNLEKLKALNNEKVLKVVEEYIKLCKPEKVTVLTDAKEDIEFMRQKSLDNKEETPLEMEGHTIHFDGMNDQARDKANTKVLIHEGEFISSFINSEDRDKGLKEVLSYLDGSMKMPIRK